MHLLINKKEELAAALQKIFSNTYKVLDSLLNGELSKELAGNKKRTVIPESDKEYIRIYVNDKSEFVFECFTVKGK